MVSPFSKQRKKLIEILKDHEIETKIHYPKLICEMEPFKNNKIENLNHLETQKIISTNFICSIGSHLSDNVILYICDLIKNLVTKLLILEQILPEVVMPLIILVKGV